MNNDGSEYDERRSKNVCFLNIVVQAGKMSEVMQAIGRGYITPKTYMHLLERKEDEGNEGQAMVGAMRDGWGVRL